MKRTKEILNYANSFKGKGMENEELKEIIRLAIIDGAMWADKTMIEKVCDYLKKLVYQNYPGGPLERMVDDEYLEELREAMKE